MHLAKYRAFIKPIVVSTVALGLSISAPRVAAAEETQDVIPMPAKMDYTPGMQIPPQYRLVEGPRKALLISGAVTFGVSYLSMVGFGIYGIALGEAGSGITAMIPFLGPFGFAFAPYGSGFNWVHTTFLVDGILQVAGAGLLIAGAVTPGKYLKRKDIAAAIPAVSVGPRSVGLQWTF